MTCARYQELRTRMELASREARTQEISLYRHEPFAVALQNLRAHAEICEVCIQDLASAFPELAGKTLIIDPLSEKEVPVA